MKHPHAAQFHWRCQNGKYLHWYHNHGGAAIRNHPQRRSMAYENRNPVWLSGGVEVETAGCMVRKFNGASPKSFSTTTIPSCVSAILILSKRMAKST